MARLYVTRRETFSAAHRLHSPQLSEQENQELYGPCNNIHGHGHNYTIEVGGCLTVSLRHCCGIAGDSLGHATPSHGDGHQHIRSEAHHQRQDHDRLGPQEHRPAGGVFQTVWPGQHHREPRSILLEAARRIHTKSSSSPPGQDMGDRQEYRHL